MHSIDLWISRDGDELDANRQTELGDGVFYIELDLLLWKTVFCVFIVHRYQSLHGHCIFL